MSANRRPRVKLRPPSMYRSPTSPLRSASRWAGSDVADVDDVEPALDVERDLAQQHPADQAIGGPGGVVGTEHEGRVDDHQRQAVGGNAKCLHLGLVLGVDVGDPEVSGREGLILVGGATRLGGPDRPGRGGVDDSLDRRPQRLLHHDPGAADVDLEHALGAAVPHRGRAGAVKDPLGAVHRPPHRAPVGDVAGGPLELDSVEVVEVGVAASEQSQLVAAPRQGPDDVRADEARAPGDQRFRHCRGSYCRPPRPSPLAGITGGSGSDRTGCLECRSQNRGRLRHDRLSPRRARRRSPSRADQPLRLGRRRSAARVGDHRLRRLLRAAARIRQRCHHLPALGRRLHRGL